MYQRIKLIVLALIAGTQMFCNANEQELLLERMGADSYEIRQKAYGELNEWALNNKSLSIPLLYENLQLSLSPEVNMRVNEILREIVLSDHFGRPPGFIGIELGSLLMPIDGKQVPVVVINRVIPDSAATKLGLKPGDVISSLEGKRMTEHELRNSGMTAEALFISRVSKKFKGDQLHLGMYEDGEERDAVLTLGERPDYLPSSKPKPSQAVKDAYYEQWLKDKKAFEPSAEK
ncbi:PDZ domain-containing protein [Rubritalea sp.]|uniref:PDZ domain-containing protein n=1 Tax=Rubritalea sp. TaxID=2109375 RepID=UPI003EF63C15